ncbi:efflux transporter outer membrane subunit [Nguyenibacter vanlangensis]|uniref:Efflux transporter outer membrane subunit n=1 Tax=Nguyenibacter vanlangensis TaxID=1216886 RepID=A0A7Y7ITY5_9PROT|nr:efflux transporter outer membrane subunit [Nguyenibacter vanlangensis]NVN10107.1 efflux transporter outer membrane subunit [Nguyenibacter vanlangensis]
MKRSILSLLAVLVCGGCDLGPDYHRPAMQQPQAWQDAGVPAARWPEAAWWKAFGSPQLDALIDRAMQDNTDLAAATARIEQADGQARQAGAALLPSVGLGGNVGPARSLSLLGKERHRIDYEGVVQASYELDFWGKNRAWLEGARATAQASRYARQVVALSTEAAVAGAYFQYLAFRDQAAAAQRNLKQARRTLDGLSAMRAAGTIPELDLVQQRTIVGQLTAAVPPLEQQAEHMRIALAILVGVLPEDLSLRPERLADLRSPPVIAGLPSGLLARRPDVRAAEADLMAANANVKMARAAFFPSIDLTAQGGIETYALTHYTVPPLGIYSLAASLSQPIFEGGRLRGQLNVAEGRYEELLQAYRKTALSAFGDVEDALSATTQTSREQQAQDMAAGNAAQSYAMAQEAYRGGTTTILNILTAEGALATAQGAQIQAQQAHLQAVLGVYQALGGGWSGGTE